MERRELGAPALALALEAEEEAEAEPAPPGWVLAEGEARVLAAREYSWAEREGR